ncbi:HD-GYP domain-containing protein [Buttiauxella brennerae]|uniref:HD-GYP domain-containing protein n=1 Tax=Buttiauxella brennerae TaxID=82988 RepID=UPI00286ED2FA|nr:HD domain-containing phosphohydrolase [Buttiauxella brennerae]
MKINLFQVLSTIASAIEASAPELNGHHKRTAFIANELASELDLLPKCREDIFISALLHDIGGLVKKDYFIAIDDQEPYSHAHAAYGASIFKMVPLLKDKASIILNHHQKWKHGFGEGHNDESIPFASHIIYLADRIDIQFLKLRNGGHESPVEQCIEIIRNEVNTRYHPRAVEAFLSLANKTYFWLALSKPFPLHLLKMYSPIAEKTISLDELMDFGRLLNTIIDMHCDFTRRHSSHVGIVSRVLAEHCHYSEVECKKIELAGYLHDIGKLAIPVSLLQKEGKISATDLATLRSHSYYTFEILSSIDAITDIARWAGMHHEKPNGSGYPFGLRGEEIEQQCLIVAVADVFVALTENRPYRRCMPSEKVREILIQEAENGSLDNELVKILLAHREEIMVITDNMGLAHSY